MSDEQRGGGAPTDEDRARAFREQMKSLHAFDLAYDMMIGLVSFGYQKLGLTDETSELRDLGDARLAIELLRANLEVVEREQGVGRTRDLRSTLAQMQLGYAQAVHLAGAAPAARPRAAAPAAREPAPDEPAAREPAAAEGPAADVPAPDEAAPDEAAAREAAPMTPPRRRPAEKPAPKKSVAKKPAPKKSAPKKPAPKKSAPKKPAPKKSAPKKPRGGATAPAD